jgi:hypothetical protein
MTSMTKHSRRLAWRYDHGPTAASAGIPDAVSYQRSDDGGGTCPLPEHGSHSQGNHGAEYAPRGDQRSPMQPRDRQFTRGGDDVLALALSNRGLADDNARLRMENQALTSQNTALLSTKKEVQQYLDENFEKFVQMKSAIEHMRQQAAIIFETKKPK